MAFITVLTLAVGIGASALAAKRWQHAQRRRRIAFIDRFRYPTRLARETTKRYPHLGPEDLARVEQGLKQYFRLCVRSGGRMVSMPSQAVDAMWHAWILDTAAYQRFCRHAFGRFLHHRPAESMRSATQARAGIQRAWALACAEEGVSLQRPSRVPLLFGLDRSLAIPDGFHYVPDCRASDNGGSNPYCGADIGGCSSGGDGSDGGHGGDGSGSDGGCGSGCGSGCGGGCGGD